MVLRIIMTQFNSLGLELTSLVNGLLRNVFILKRKSQTELHSMFKYFE